MWICENLDLKFQNSDIHRPKYWSMPPAMECEHISRIIQYNSNGLYKLLLRTKSVTKKEMNKCMAETYDPGGIPGRPVDKPIP